MIKIFEDEEIMFDADNRNRVYGLSDFVIPFGFYQYPHKKPHKALKLAPYNLKSLCRSEMIKGLKCDYSAKYFKCTEAGEIYYEHNGRLFYVLKNTL